MLKPTRILAGTLTNETFGMMAASDAGAMQRAFKIGYGIDHKRALTARHPARVFAFAVAGVATRAFGYLRWRSSPYDNSPSHDHPRRTASADAG
ncbi:MAG TPA: hypothetical protein VL048_03805 [Xanthobacteraceae bacterium]|nr:hypothetical protein [Xanthobacteraceae bacterium]